eukprot:CAMPEP_0202472116 /NCGR_PEP_ID=MMETSP1360-20130828/86719_1 /ASSEMBLY_ACC=CAM_ASM_000848 /TAXON_ID=515479 /ORGANISM="Licmophora paradoxa, Strain CCMP2313" /LENGTH=147 /DNA_ID=CAMNT_0049098445 /DNA_START=129 /DNA_END=572 /DNA_ORIENTATION=+
MGTATVGAPPTFVENFNIRLTSQCDKAKARTLTKKLRERDGGLLGVEGLTLPYSDSRYEVACNMLRPDVGSATAIQNIVQEWVEENRKETSPTSPCGSEIELVDTMYRVGTTAEMCLEVLSVCQDDSGRAEHDSRVSEKLRAYLDVS